MQSANYNTGAIPSNQTSYIPLPLKIQKNGFLYFQLIRTGNFALYRQIKNDQIIGYEVFKIRKSKERVLLGKYFPAQELMPCNDWFGLDAWSVGRDMSKAIDFFRLKDKEFRQYSNAES